MEVVFKRLGEVDSKKSERIARINAQKSNPDDFEDLRVTDYKATQISMTRGFKSVFGGHCDILAMILYQRASQNQDYISLNIV